MSRGRGAEGLVMVVLFSQVNPDVFESFLVELQYHNDVRVLSLAEDIASAMLSL